MNAILLILIILSIFIILTTLYLIHKYDKVVDRQLQLIEETTDTNKRLADERKRIVNIIIFAKISKENYFKTIEKLEKELDIPQNI